jgi:hypothetical protein
MCYSQKKTLLMVILMGLISLIDQLIELNLQKFWLKLLKKIKKR